MKGCEPKHQKQKSIYLSGVADIIASVMQVTDFRSGYTHTCSKLENNRK